jgi:quercetin dioxygenase-like cupin family protein
VHHVGRLSETSPGSGIYADRSAGLTRIPIVGRAEGSVHQGVAIAELEPGGGVDRHLHAFEEAIYVLSGRLTLGLPGSEEELATDDYAFVEKGVPHALRTAGSEPVRWLEVAAPQPDAEMIDDTVFLDGDVAIDLPELAFRRSRFELSELPEPSSAIGLAGFGAANVGGAALKILVNSDFGASQLILMVVQYAPGGYIAEHDHAFEEAFFFVEGEIEAVLDGETYTLRAGDYCWSGVESRHALANRSDEPVRWLETQVPQPPSRHQARFKAEWERLASGASPS